MRHVFFGLQIAVDGNSANPDNNATGELAIGNTASGDKPRYVLVTTERLGSFVYRLGATGITPTTTSGPYYYGKSGAHILSCGGNTHVAYLNRSGSTKRIVCTPLENQYIPFTGMEAMSVSADGISVDLADGATNRVAIPNDASGNRAKLVALFSEDGGLFTARPGDSTVVSDNTKDIWFGTYTGPVRLNVAGQTHIGFKNNSGSTKMAFVVPLENQKSTGMMPALSIGADGDDVQVAFNGVSAIAIPTNAAGNPPRYVAISSQAGVYAVLPTTSGGTAATSGNSPFLSYMDGITILNVEGWTHLSMRNYGTGNAIITAVPLENQDVPMALSYGEDALSTGNSIAAAGTESTAIPVTSSGDPPKFVLITCSPDSDFSILPGSSATTASVNSVRLTEHTPSIILNVSGQTHISATNNAAGPEIIMLTPLENQ